jgi:hypothetical protein
MNTPKKFQWSVKQQEMVEVKFETIDQFLARGGKISKARHLKLIKHNNESKPKDPVLDKMPIAS